MSKGNVMEGKEYNDWINFGIRLKNARNSIGMTVEKLAEKTNRTENFIQRIESGKKSCSIHTLYQFCKVLNTSTDSLLLGDNVEIKEFKDREVIENILNNCNEKQLRVVKDVLIAICPNYDDLKKEV